MSSVLPTIANHWSESQPGAAGALGVTGNKVVVGGARLDKELLTVSAAGDLLPNNPSQVFRTTTDIPVLLYADTGPIDFLYAQASTALPRGTLLAKLPIVALGDPVRLVTAAATDIVVGVALWNIDDEAFVWVPCKGVVLALTNAAVTTGDLLAPGAGNLVAAATPADAVAIAEETTGGGGLARVRLLGRGI